MTPETADTTVRTCLSTLSELLQEASSLAKAATGCAEDGNRNGAIGIMLDVEPLLHEAISFLNVASAVHRRSRP